MIDDKKLSDLYRQGAIEKPPESLDQEILHHAHMATVRNNRWHRWQWPASAAASIMLCSTLYLLYTDKSEFDLSMPPTSAPISELQSLPVQQKASVESATRDHADNKLADEVQPESLNEQASSIASMAKSLEKAERLHEQQVEEKASVQKRSMHNHATQQRKERSRTVPEAPVSSPVIEKELPGFNAAQGGAIQDSAEIDDVAVPEVQGQQDVDGRSGKLQIIVPKRKKKIHPQYSPETGKVTPHHLLKQEQHVLSAEEYIEAIKKALLKGDKDKAAQLLQELQTHYPDKWGNSKLEIFEQ